MMTTSIDAYAVTAMTTVAMISTDILLVILRYKDGPHVELHALKLTDGTCGLLGFLVDVNAAVLGTPFIGFESVRL